jgi:hypothetical protein
MVKGDPKSVGDLMECIIERFLKNKPFHSMISEETIEVAKTFFGQLEGTTLDQKEVASRVWLCMCVTGIIACEVPGMDKQFAHILQIVKLAGLLTDISLKKDEGDGGK